MRPYPRPTLDTPGSPTIWCYRYTQSFARLGMAHPATQAALGRWYGLRSLAGLMSAVPQREMKSPAAIAWHRASKAQPGYMNRRYRKWFESDVRF